MTDPRMTPTNDAPVTVEGYAEAEAMLSDIIRADLISNTAIRIARDHMMQFVRHRLAALGSAPAGDGVADRYSAGYSQGTIDADQQQQWMQDKAWQDAVLMLVHYSTLAERTWLVGHEEAARKLGEWWGHARALADTKSADDMAALARPRAAVGDMQDLLDVLASMVEKPWSSSEAGDWVLAEAARLLSALQSQPAKVEG